jgi:hypothetical protein
MVERKSERRTRKRSEKKNTRKIKKNNSTCLLDPSQRIRLHRRSVPRRRDCRVRRQEEQPIAFFLFESVEFGGCFDDDGDDDDDDDDDDDEEEVEQARVSFLISNARVVMNKNSPVSGFVSSAGTSASAAAAAEDACHATAIAIRSKGNALVRRRRRNIVCVDLFSGKKEK